MLKDSLGRLYQKTIFLQALLVLIFTVFAVVVAGKNAAISTLTGGVAVVVSSVVYAALARKSKVSAVSAGSVLRQHLTAEAAKIIVVLTLLLCALISGWFAAGWLVAAMGVTLLGHLLSVFIIR